MGCQDIISQLLLAHWCLTVNVLQGNYSGDCWPDLQLLTRKEDMSVRNTSNSHLKVPGVWCKDLLAEYVRLALYFPYLCPLLLAPKSTAGPELWCIKIQCVLKKLMTSLYTYLTETSERALYIFDLA